MKAFAKRMVNIILSASIAMAQRAGARDKDREVIDLTWGQSDFHTPEHIEQAAYKALASGKNYYTPSAGIPEFRDSIARFHADQYGAKYDSGTEVLVTPGAKQGLMYLLQLIVDPGDEVILFEPCWLSYRDMVFLNQGIPKFIPANDDLSPDLNVLENVTLQRYLR